MMIIKTRSVIKRVDTFSNEIRFFIIVIVHMNKREAIIILPLTVIVLYKSLVLTSLCNNKIYHVFYKYPDFFHLTPIYEIFDMLSLRYLLCVHLQKHSHHIVHIHVQMLLPQFVYRL